MRARNIYQYVASLGLRDVGSLEEAIIAVTRASKDETPLHKRGHVQSHIRYHWAQPAPGGIPDDEWKEASQTKDIRSRALKIKRLVRRGRVRVKMEAKGQLALSRLGLPTIPEADEIAIHNTSELQKSIAEGIHEIGYPFASKRSSITVYVSIAKDESVYAKYDKGILHITIAKRASLDHLLPCKRVLSKFQKAIILDHLDLGGGLHFMKWAAQGKYTSVIVQSGAMKDGVLIPGYESPEDVLGNAELIHEQARVISVKRAILQE